MTYQVLIVARLQDQALDMIADRELPPRTRLVKLEDPLQLLLDRSQRVLGYGAHVHERICTSEPSEFVRPLDKWIVHEGIEDVHQTVFVLSQKPQGDLAGDTEHA